MGYFPFFIDIGRRKCLVVGGGKVALRKIEKLLPYEPEITVAAPRICEEIRRIKGITLIEREFSAGDIEGAFLVIGATDSEKTNAEIYRLCTEKGILVNIVDDRDKCGFIFPSLVKKGDISIGVSSSGSSPVFSRYIKERIEEILSERELEIQRLLAESRDKVKRSLPAGEKRREALEEILRLAENGAESIDTDRIIMELSAE